MMSNDVKQVKKADLVWRRKAKKYESIRCAVLVLCSTCYATDDMPVQKQARRLRIMELG
jgi:hypothetical protein